MLSWLRNNAKIFLIAIIVIFVVMIFVDWGRGRVSAAQASRFIIARINGRNLLPDQYDAARSYVYSSLENQMQASGDPAPENQLALMYNEINEMSFNRMIDEELEEEYLKSLDWPKAGIEHADAILLSQMRLSGIPDPEQYLKQYRNDPNYTMTLYQLVMQANSRRFQSAISIENMASREETEFMLLENFTPITARYISFREMPDIPNENAMEQFYYDNMDLFTDPPNCTLKYVTILVQTSPQDEERSLGFVDSLALSGTAIPDSIVMTRSQFLAFAGWNMELEPGEFSEPFTGASFSNTGFPMVHSVRLLSISEAVDDSSDGAEDTLAILHWEVPILPGYQTMRNTFWAVEEAMDDLLAQASPRSDSLVIADWGDLYIDENTISGYEIPAALKAFALDSIWADSTGPVFYLPSFRGSYPAFMVARRLQFSTGGLLSLEEADFSGRLLLSTYTEIERELSITAALAAREYILHTGISLGMYAAEESLEIESTPEFTVFSIRHAALTDPYGYMGITSSREFADAALVFPELEIIGPFVSGSTAYLVEITSRLAPELPEDRAMLAPISLSSQQVHGSRAILETIEELRAHSEIEDLREEYYALIDSLRAAQPQQ